MDCILMARGSSSPSEVFHIVTQTSQNRLGRVSTNGFVTRVQSATFYQNIRPGVKPKRYLDHLHEPFCLRGSTFGFIFGTISIQSIGNFLPSRR